MLIQASNPDDLYGASNLNAVWKAEDFDAVYGLPSPIVSNPGRASNVVETFSCLNPVGQLPNLSESLTMDGYSGLSLLTINRPITGQDLLKQAVLNIKKGDDE